MNTPDGDGNLPSGDGSFVESLKVCQYAFSRVMKTAIRVVADTSRVFDKSYRILRQESFKL